MVQLAERVNALSTPAALATPDPRIQQLLDRVNILTTPAPIPTPDPRIEEFIERVNSLSTPAPSNRADARIDQLVERVNNLSTPVALPTPDPRIQQLVDRINILATPPPTPTPDARIGQLVAEVLALDAKLSEFKSITPTPAPTQTPTIVVATPTPTPTPATPFQIQTFSGVGTVNTLAFPISSAPIKITWTASRPGKSVQGNLYVDLSNPSTGSSLARLIEGADLDSINAGENLIYGLPCATYFLEIDPTFGDVRWTVTIWGNPI